MKTAKEILESKLYFNKGLVLNDLEKLVIYDAMQEYAQQEAIEFAKWLDNVFCSVSFDEDNDEVLYEAYQPEAYPDKDYYTVSELYKTWKDENARSNKK